MIVRSDGVKNSINKLHGCKPLGPDDVFSGQLRYQKKVDECNNDCIH